MVKSFFFLFFSYVDEADQGTGEDGENQPAAKTKRKVIDFEYLGRCGKVSRGNFDCYLKAGVKGFFKGFFKSTFMCSVF